MQAPPGTSAVTAAALEVADRRLLSEQGGRVTNDDDGVDSGDEDLRLVDDRDLRAPTPPRRPGKGKIGLNARNAAVRSELSEKWFARAARCARSSPSASR